MAIESRPSNPIPTEVRGVPDLSLDAEKRKMFQQHDEIVLSLAPYLESKLRNLTPVDRIKQPSDFLPNLIGLNPSDRAEVMHQYWSETDRLSDGLFAVIAFHGVTEEALPSYQTWFGRFPAIFDKTGIDQSPWSKFERWWTAEEHRHGIQFNGTLRFSGKVKMREYERSVQSLIRNGVDPRVDPGDTYGAINYAASQEEETYVASIKGGKIALTEGSQTIYKMFISTGSDERRHADVYEGLYGKIVELDPEGAVISFWNNLARSNGLVMPGALVTSGEDTNVGPTKLFRDLVKIEIAYDGFTPVDYAQVLEHLVERWDIEHLSVGGNAEAENAQIEIMKLLARRKEAGPIFTNRIRTSREEIRLPFFDNPIPLRQNHRI